MSPSFRKAELGLVSLVMALVACGPGRVGTDAGEDEVAEDDDAADVDVPRDLLDDGHVFEIENVPTDLEQIALGAIAHFENSEPPRRCPHPNGSPEGGEASITPEIGIDCSVGPDHRCVPAVGGGGTGYYDIYLWFDNPVWFATGFAKTEPHCFKYNLKVANDLDGTGSCSFTAQAFGDLDADQIFSTYELRGSVDENGSNLQPLFMDLPYE